MQRLQSQWKILTESGDCKMKERKFKVGERYTSKLFVDKGAVIEITEISGGTVFYKDVVGESICLKHFQIGSIFSAALEKVDTTIVIYRKDNKVIALDKSTGEKAEANCNPADEFDFRTGAKLAFNRLMGEDVKPDNGVREVKRKLKSVSTSKLWMRNLFLYHMKTERFSE